MVEYLASVVLMSALLGVLSYSSYPSDSSARWVKIASAVLLLYVVINPVFALSKELLFNDGGGFFDEITNDFAIDDSQLLETSEEAFKEGIKRLVKNEFGADEKNVEVYVFGFDFKNMRAEKIKIILSGRSAFLDWRGIEKYITEAGLGDCEVNIQLE